ncbi:hypothetical protein GCM10007916_10040 [Psychromonas marina]|uniref:DGQHR domain-containing protein n=1 Tax=Psychromonas marina TaxID=88364 RepID=A0ABQ6DXW5_9GAMM|nr:hypothetical protein [Psychromonas marina]GLS89937.1 hypothetical protein GCM10007916_10040 [Psychromonas marina]
MKIHALQKNIVSGNQEFPIYIGFLTAQELLSVAEVPNFKDDTHNIDIASNVLAPPVQQWQRPLIKANKDRITATFNGTGEFMPNPVLLSERCVGNPPKIQVEQMKSAAGIATDIIEIDIPLPSSQKDFPLWIIDGQHRITGLGDSKCVQRDNPIPVVLLLNNGGQFYNGRNLAKIFAQVTTEATPLASLHKEWLTFAFHLDGYTKNSPSHKSMEAVATLCKQSLNSFTNKPNGFHDDIRFNDFLPTSPKYLGHQYDCKYLSKLISDNYYSESILTNELKPAELANQISMAFDELKKCVKLPQEKSVFFGTGDYCHKIMCDAFIVGVLSYLANRNSAPDSDEWEDLLLSLNFNTTDWNFSQYVKKGTRWVEKSKKLAIGVFKSIFEQGSLPAKVYDIWDYLSGDQLFIEIESKHINQNGKAIQKNSSTTRVERGAKKTIPMASRKYFKITKKSLSAMHFVIVDSKSSVADAIKFKPTGEYLKLPKVDLNKPSQDPLCLTIKFTLYGGNEEEINITLRDWK